LRGVEALQVRVEFVELELDASTALHDRSTRLLVHLLLLSHCSCVELTLDLILVGLQKLEDHAPDELHLFAVGFGEGGTKVSQVGLGLLQLVSALVDDRRQVVLDMSEQYFGKFLRQIVTSEDIIRHGRVDWVRREEHPFLSDGLLDRNTVLDIFLCAILHTDVAEAQWDFLVHNHAFGVGATIHDIDLGDYTDSADTFRINLQGHLEPIIHRHILVGRHHTEDDSPRIRHISEQHFADNLLDVLGLIRALQGNAGDSGQIDQGEIRAGVREDLQDKRLVQDTLVCSTGLIRQILDLLPDHVEIGELFSLQLLREDTPRRAHFVQVGETQLEWPPSHEATTARQEIQTDNRLEHGRFTGGLSSKHCYSR